MTTTMLTAAALTPIAAALTATVVYGVGTLLAQPAAGGGEWEHRHDWPAWRAYRHRGRHRRRSTHARAPMLPPATVRIRFLADPQVRRRLSPDWRTLLDPEAR